MLARNSALNNQTFLGHNKLTQKHAFDKAMTN